MMIVHSCVYITWVILLQVVMEEVVGAVVMVEVAAAAAMDVDKKTRLQNPRPVSGLCQCLTVSKP